METFYQTLIDRRLSVSSDLGGYKHAALVFNKRSTLSYGQNYLLSKNSAYNSVHAEHDAIINLPVNEKKHAKKVDILVIRASRTGKLGMSRPCDHCVRIMNELARQKGYYISNVYYSTNDGTIIKEKLMNISGYKSGFFRLRNKFL